MILLGLGSLIGIVSTLWIGSTLVASANRDIGNPPSTIPFAEFSLPSDSGAELAAWNARRDGSAVTVILLHPIRGSRNSMLSRAEFLYNAGYSVMLIDMQAHGESIGRQITLGHLEKHDVRAAVADVRRKYPDDKVVVVGNSLGGAATLLAAPIDVDAVVLESVYTRIETAIKNRIGIRLGPFSNLLSPLLTVQIEPRLGVALEDLQPIDQISKLDCPVLVLAGQNDEHTTIKDSEDLFNAANEPKKMEVFPKAKHVDFHRVATEMYEDTVLAFLQEHAPTRTPVLTTEEATHESPDGTDS